MYEHQINSGYSLLRDVVLQFATAQGFVDLNERARLSIGKAVSAAEQNRKILTRKEFHPLASLDDCFDFLMTAILELPKGKHAGMEGMGTNVVVHHAAYAQLLQKGQEGYVDADKIDGTPLYTARKYYDSLLSPR